MMEINDHFRAPINFFSSRLKSIISLFLCAFFIVISTHIPWNLIFARSAFATATSTPVGTISGEFSVNGNGGATYVVPIEVPPGINGVQPNLSVVYNSQQENGLLGVGWNLAGLSAIARCGKTKATDGEIGGVNFDGNDRFCYDGQRLIAVSGNYGAEGTEYHTERETWVKVVSHTEEGRNGPKSFTITTKDGQKLEFGTRGDSQIEARERSDKAISVWALSKITDRNGNYVEITYTIDKSGQIRESVGAAEFSGYHPLEIRYTGNSDVKPQRLVKFGYEDREDRIEAYTGGSDAEITKRLSSISTYVDLDGDGNEVPTVPNLVKKYNLNYQYSTTTGRSQLKSLEECDSGEVCLPATQFGWQEGNNNFQKAPISFSLPGKIFWHDPKGFASRTEGVLQDFNGDGLVDFSPASAWKNPGKPTYYDCSIWLNTGNDFKKADYLLPNKMFWHDLNGFASRTEGVLQDFNGDGLVDFSRASAWKGTTNKDYSIWLNTGNGFKKASYSLPGKIFWHDVNGFASRAEGVLQDFNGDGLVDFSPASDWEGTTNQNYGIYLNTGNGFEDKPSYDLPGKIFWHAKNGFASRTEGILQDFNGDGLVDFSPASAWKGTTSKDYSIRLNTGSSSSLLSAITDGLGRQTLIGYKPLTDKTVYTKGTGAKYPEVDVQAPMYVVSEHRQYPPGRVDESNGFVYEYKYEGAKTDRNRGWLGFEKNILIDKQNNTKTITTFSTKFPILGMMLSREIKDDRDNLLGKTVSTYESSKDSRGIYKVWNTESKIEYYTERNPTPNYALQKKYTYDSEYKNVTAISDLGDVSSPEDEVYTCLTYLDGTGSDWWKGFFPQQQKTVNSDSACKFEGWNAATDLRWEKYEYDPQMNLASRSQYWDRNEGKWLKSSTTYDTYGNVVGISDPVGNTSTTSYEAKYHTFPETSTTPDPDPNNPSDSPLTVTTTYEPKFGIKTQVVDPNGHKSMEILDSGIDGFGRILEVKGIKPDSEAMVTVGKTEFNQESNGLSVKTWYRTQWEGDNVPNDENWLWEQEYIDALGRSYQSESKGYNSQTKLIGKVQYNARGQVEKSYLPYYSDADPNNNQNYTSYQYDIRGQVTQTTYPNGTVSKTDYSKQYSDRQLTYQLPDPTEGMEGVNFVNSIVKETSRGWIEHKVAPNNSDARYEYDLLGQVVRIIDPLGEVTEMGYDSLGKVTSETNPETGTTKYIYNDNGNLVSLIDAKQQKISFQYDNLGRATTKQVYDSQSDPNPAKTVTYQYDDPAVANGKGALTKIVMPEGTYSFAYNNRGETSQEKIALNIEGTQKAFVTGYSYDAAGRPDTITYPDGSIVRHSYNYQGQMHTVDMQQPGATDFTTYATYDNYSSLGDFQKIVYNNGVESNYQYDKIGRIKKSTTLKGSYNYLNFTYDWNKANKLLSINDLTDKELTETFKYDNVGRLIGATGSYPSITYNYGLAGNISQRNDQTFTYKPDKKHQLADAEYDTNGNTTKYGAWGYTYDAENRLLKVNNSESGNASTINEFTYDDAGDRLVKIEADGTKTYYVSPLYEVVKQSSGKEVHTKYIVGLQGVVAAISQDGNNVNLTAGLDYNTASLEANMYNLRTWGGLRQFLSTKIFQFAYYPYLGQLLAIVTLIGWLLLAVVLWADRFCRSASRKSWLGKLRGQLLQQLVQWGWLTSETADRLNTPTPTNWLIGAWHRPGSFALVLVAFSSMNLTAPITLAQLTPGVNGAGYPVAEKILYFHHGHLSSTSLVTDAQANQVSLVNYEPYGEVAASSEGENTFRAKFTGKEFDHYIGLYYFGSRYYDAHLGRFLTPDPARQYFSPYIYGNGDPLGGIDPDGEQFVLLAIIAVGAYMGGAAVNHSINFTSWDWSSGKTYAGIIGGAAIGGVTAGAGLAATGAVAAAELGTAATAAANIAIAGGMMGTMNASFTAMGGGNIGDIAAAFGSGFGMGALFATPVLGELAFLGMTARDEYKFINDPSAGNGIQLAMDVLFMGMEAGERLPEGGESEFCTASFVAETEVLSSKGEKAIEEVAVGDLVWAYNEETEQEGLYPVSHLFTRIAPESILITAGDEVIETTTEHEFYVDSKGWVEAEDLSLGDKLVQHGGNIVTLTALQPHEKSVRVYNFEVDKAHTYFVSGEELLVHNCGGGDINKDNIIDNKNRGSRSASKRRREQWEPSSNKRPRRQPDRLHGPRIKEGSAGGASAGSEFSASVKKAAFKENPRICVFCRDSKGPFEVDHVIPKNNTYGLSGTAQDGNATLENAQIACKRCNSSKGNTRLFPKTKPPSYTGPWPPYWWPYWWGK